MQTLTLYQQMQGRIQDFEKGSLVPRPYLSRGKGSGELRPNPRFSFYGARRLGHAKLGSDWSVWLHRRLAVKQSWDLIGQHDCVCNLASTASNGDVAFLR